MRNVLLSFCLLVTCFACSKQTSPEEPIVPPLAKPELNRSEINFTGIKGSVDSILISSAGKWEADQRSIPEWIKLSDNNGEGNSKIYLTVISNNAAGINRLAYVIFRLIADTSKKVSLRIHQEAREWKSRTSQFPGNLRENPFVFEVGNMIFLGLGKGNFSPETTYQKDFFLYNPYNNSWATAGIFPGPSRGEGLSFSIDDKAYIFKGKTFICTELNNPMACKTTFFHDLWEFTWQNLGWRKIGEFPEINVDQYSQVHKINGKIYLVNQTQIIEFNPSTYQFTTINLRNNMSNWLGTGFAIDDKIFVIAATNPSFPTPDFTSNVYCYDLSENTWTQKNPFPGKGRRYAIGFTLEGTGYIGFGVGNHYSPGNVSEIVGEYLNDVWQYNADNDSWKSIYTHEKTFLYRPVFTTLSGDRLFYGGIAQPLSSSNDWNTYWYY
ncbi:hypothetical protein [Pollutibacter soli]|uniref:hypothetical protein n=1 Tax=Pollutibacter soli TaxID=3034157 RepID=UPI003013D199